ncbi:hypothetical protein CXB51_018152 [Gossypium anomalum]|uniref:TITAN-like protein n=1 Tax=Gossypium anomalum TaxID=47600 RepID=A0A8J5YLS2_9ROSI|nr:hypothetical protein CXB51_018152 [Gossypium anomalum]
MADHSVKPNTDSKLSFTNQNHNVARREEEKKKDKKCEFEFCKVCKLNHNQGPRHKYFPNHKAALSSFLCRFQNKINDVRFFLRNPNVLRPEHADRNRFWCVFCDTDVDELDSSFACENAINHLAGGHHLKNLKHFLWQYGGKMDQLDKYRISETDLTKWEKKCESLKVEAMVAPTEGSGLKHGASNDIHYNVSIEKINNLGQNTLNSVKPSYSNVVLPLQYNTNEYQISNSRFPEVSHFGSNFHGANFSNTSLLNSNDLKANSSGQQNLLYNGICSGNAYLSDVGGCQVYQNASMVSRESSSQGLQSLTQVSSISTIDAGGNVHSGALPPWLEAADQTLLNNQVKPALSSFISSNKSQKSRKLNPKRVGAAWAEKRKMELEKEKRGEIVESDCDANWLPNFGRVWQSGSRKESRKEFDIEKHKFLRVESHSEMPVNIQPYISKRMRKDIGE